MASRNVKSNETISDEELGLTPPTSEDKKPSDILKEETKEAYKKAATATALKAAVEVESNINMNQLEKTYLINKRKAMLSRCKSDKVVKINCPKIYENIFGKVYSFCYNTVPVTVKFDGTDQEFPEFIAKRLQEKFNEVAQSNVPKNETEER